MKPLLKKWLDRVEASEIERGKILQLQTCIWPRSIGYETAGRKTTLDYDDCDQIVLAFQARVERDRAEAARHQAEEIIDFMLYDLSLIHI